MTAPQIRPTVKPKAAPRPPAAPPPAAEAAPDSYAPERPQVTLPLPPGLTVPTQPQVGVDQLELMARLAAVEARLSGGMVEPSPQPRAAEPEVDESQLSDWQRQILARTRPTPQDFRPSPISYNFPLRLYMKRDRSFQWLQGSPQALAMYTEKGFTALTPEETEHWLKVERPEELKKQRRKAQLVSGLRRLIALNPQIQNGLGPEFDNDLSDMSVEQLEAQWADLTAQTGARVSLPRPQALVDRETAQADRQMAGIETQDSVSREKLEQKLGQAWVQGRLVEMSPTDRR